MKTTPKPATRFTFITDNGEYPRHTDGKVLWSNDRNETIQKAAACHCSILVEMDDEGRRLNMVNLKSPHEPLTTIPPITPTPQAKNPTTTTPSPKITDLQDLAAKWNMPQIIVLAVNPKTGTYEVTSFGKTKKLCAQAKTINEQIFNMVANGVIEIDQP